MAKKKPKNYDLQKKARTKRHNILTPDEKTLRTPIKKSKRGRG